MFITYKNEIYQMYVFILVVGEVIGIVMRYLERFISDSYVFLFVCC